MASDSETEDFILSSMGQGSDPINVILEVNGAKVQFLIDTGAARTVVPKRVSDLFGKLNQLKPASIRLRTYTKETIPLAGESKVKVVQGSRSADLLLCLDILKNAQVNNIKDVQSINPHGISKILNKYSDLFINDYKGSKLKVSLHLKNNAIPKFIRARPVP